MGKIKKSSGNSPKENFKKRHSLLSTTEKSNSPKNRRKTLGSAPLKQFKAVKTPKVLETTENVELEPKAEKLSKANVEVLEASADETGAKLKPKRLSKTTVKSSKILKTKTFKSAAKNQKKKQSAQEIIDSGGLKSGIKALFQLLDKTKNEKKELFEDPKSIFMQVSAIKIANCPSRILHLPLKHKLLDDSSDICLITADVQGILKKDHEKAAEHYENLLRKHEITNIKKIMPFHEFRTEYGEFELKRKLIALYDTFLVEGKVAGYVMKSCGKIFQEKRKLPVAVKLHIPKVKNQISNALLKSPMHVHPRGDNFIVEVARTNMNEDAIFDNIMSVCETLQQQFPGGWKNIKCLNIKTAKSMSIPIYYNVRNPSDVAVPVVERKLPKAFKAVEGELSTMNDATVTVNPSGEVVVHKQPSQQSNTNQIVKGKKQNLNKQNNENKKLIKPNQKNINKLKKKQLAVIDKSEQSGKIDKKDQKKQNSIKIKSNAQNEENAKPSHKNINKVVQTKKDSKNKISVAPMELVSDLNSVEIKKSKNKKMKQNQIASIGEIIQNGEVSPQSKMQNEENAKSSQKNNNKVIQTKKGNKVSVTPKESVSDVNSVEIKKSKNKKWKQNQIASVGEITQNGKVSPHSKNLLGKRKIENSQGDEEIKKFAKAKKDKKNIVKKTVVIK